MFSQRLGELPPGVTKDRLGASNMSYLRVTDFSQKYNLKI